jgi:hypothetical protein
MSNDTELDLTCSICLCCIENISKNIIKTECSHIFHSNCFLKNIAFNGFNCPNCRTILYDENEDTDYSDDDTYYSDEDTDYSDEQDEQDEAERIRLNGSRWLFMRAEEIKIHHYDNDDYDYDYDDEEYDEDTEYEDSEDEDDEEDEDEDDDEEYDEEYDEDEYYEAERIRLNGSRWLFMRAEEIEIHKFDNDDYEFDENDYNYENNHNYYHNYNYDYMKESTLSMVNIPFNNTNYTNELHTKKYLF